MQLLLDDQATLANIVAGLEKLAQEAKSSDTVVVFFCSEADNQTSYAVEK